MGKLSPDGSLVAGRLKEARKNAGLSQKKLGEWMLAGSSRGEWGGELVFISDSGKAIKIIHTLLISFILATFNRPVTPIKLKLYVLLMLIIVLRCH